MGLFFTEDTNEQQQKYKTECKKAVHTSKHCIWLPSFNCITFHWNRCEISKFYIFLPTTLKRKRHLLFRMTQLLRRTMQ